MYQLLKDKTLPEQVELLTKRLVQIPSVNGTVGEKNKVDQIKQWIATFPYLQQFPDRLWEQPIPGDSMGRKNIFALLKCENGSKRTVIYHSHLDTVGVKDYGAIEKDAFSPDALEQFFKKFKADPELQHEALSEDWLFGRGALDMQSGIAVHLANLLYFSKHPEKLNGNLLVMFNSDEEVEHKGIIAAISELKRLRDEAGLEYVGAVNNDFVSPLYDSDATRYIYTGAAGKLLPSFYIYGRESHVGETLKGIDSTLVASEINRRINNNMDLAEDINGEVVMPPSCLYQRDGKEAYNVQTPYKTYMYFNYFLYEEGPTQVIRKLKQITYDACAAVGEQLQQNYSKSISKTGYPASHISWHLEVSTLQEYSTLLKERGFDVNGIIKNVLHTNRGMELRELSFKIVDALQQEDSEKRPRVILFFSPPHLPHSYLDMDSSKDWFINDALHETVDEFGNEHSLSIKRFFPFLSDSSYLSLHESDEELQTMIDNFSIWNDEYSIPVRDIRSLSIPAINIGVYGKDAHKWTERVFKPYSFSTVPMMIRGLTKRLLNANE